LVVNTCSSLSSTRSNDTRPQGLSGVAPRRLTSFSEAGENSVGSTRVPVNGARSVSGTLWQVGDANSVKSPRSMAAVGMN
jgi:hypothetical protein